MPQITLAAGEGAILTGTAAVAGGVASGQFGEFSPLVRLLALGVLAACAYLGYGAYTSKPAAP
jgi:hypothetical protein